MITLLSDTLILNKDNIFSFFKNLVLMFSFAIITGIAAGLKIEIGIVPITMQTFVVLLSGLFLGSKRGAMAQLTYLTMGVSGIFWFSRGGGLAYILSPTFGYIVGFVLAAFTVGWVYERFGKRVWAIIAAIFLGSSLIYIPGVIWLSYFIGFQKALEIGVCPFFIGDTLKSGLVILISLIVKKY